MKYHEQLQSIPSYQTLTEIEAQLAAVETPKEFNPENPEHLQEQLERLRIREGLDRDMAVSAFRLDIAQSNDLFDLKTRLALLSAYDPEVHSRFERNRKQVAREMNPRSGSSIARQKAIQLRRGLSALGVEGHEVHNPMRNAETLTNELEKAYEFAELHQGARIAIRTEDESVITGVLPPLEESFALKEPVVSDDNVIEYNVPSEFSNVSDLVFYPNRTAHRYPSLTDTSYSELLEKTEEGLVAHPQLNSIRQELGLLGVNIYRSYYGAAFTESITAEADMYRPVDKRRYGSVANRRRRALRDY